MEKLKIGPRMILDFIFRFKSLDGFFHSSNTEPLDARGVASVIKQNLQTIQMITNRKKPGRRFYLRTLKYHLN